MVYQDINRNLQGETEMNKSDVEQLKGILAQFDRETIELAVNQNTVPELQPYELKTSECPDPGEELMIGSEGCIDIEEMGDLERLILPENNFLPAHFLEEGAVVQKPVARVRTSSGIGSGFLISPSLFMTNNHVVRDLTTARRTKVQFNYQLDYNGNQETVDEYQVDADPASFYTNVPLDFTIMRLKPKRIRAISRPNNEMLDFLGDEWTPNPLSPFPQPSLPSIPNMPELPSYNPRPFPMPPHIPLPRFINLYPGHRWGNLQLRANVSYARRQHINIVQHPKGRRKEVALQDNHLDKIFSNVVRYTTDTDRGSSGSPVFNNEWELIALHHAGGEKDGDTWLNNQGIRIDKIVADLRRHFGGSASGQRILSELGIS